MFPTGGWPPGILDIEMQMVMEFTFFVNTESSYNCKFKGQHIIYIYIFFINTYFFLKIFTPKVTGGTTYDDQHNLKKIN